MQLYIAKLVFRIICGDGDHTPQFDEQLRLIHAANREQAFSKAAHLAIQGEASFPNHQGETVSWQFINIAELYNLDTHTDGMEICSRVHEAVHSDDYIRFVHYKADHIRAEFTKRVEEPV